MDREKVLEPVPLISLEHQETTPFSFFLFCEMKEHFLFVFEFPTAPIIDWLSNAFILSTTWAGKNTICVYYVIMSIGSTVHIIYKYLPIILQTL